jgi:hypothetical protein
MQTALVEQLPHATKHDDLIGNGIGSARCAGNCTKCPIDGGRLVRERIRLPSFEGLSGSFWKATFES